MLAYSGVLTLAVLASSPWWLFRMLTTQRYREGLWERLGRVPGRLRDELRNDGRRGGVIWVHAVSVGEVLAATRLVRELESDSQAGTIPGPVVISTTTRTGQALARERFGAGRVFYMPLDFAWAVRRYVQALRPALLVLMESELWPRLLHECGRAGAPVVVANARVSDRSFRRGLRLRRLWKPVLRQPTLWLAQSAEDAGRLVAMGALPQRVKVAGNLKYDIRAPRQSRMAELIHEAAAGRPVLVAGSTVDGEDELVLAAFRKMRDAAPRTLLVIAPRHPERFSNVLNAAEDLAAVSATGLMNSEAQPTLQPASTCDAGDVLQSNASAVVLDTIGDLAAVYGIASVAFVGGSLVQQGGHNPLEPAQFGVPVVMGPSFQNFRGIVERLREAKAIRILGGEALTAEAAKRAGNEGEDGALRDELAQTLADLLSDPEAARLMGQRGKQVFEQQQGATGRVVQELTALLQEPRGGSR